MCCQRRRLQGVVITHRKLTGCAVDNEGHMEPFNGCAVDNEGYNES